MKVKNVLILDDTPRPHSGLFLSATQSSKLVTVPQWFSDVDLLSKALTEEPTLVIMFASTSSQANTWLHSIKHFKSVPRVLFLCYYSDMPIAKKLLPQGSTLMALPVSSRDLAGVLRDSGALV